VAELELERCQIILGNVYNGLPVVKPIVRQYLSVLCQPKSLQDFLEVWDRSAGKGRDRHEE
jgi:hypothetical protein